VFSITSCFPAESIRTPEKLLSYDTSRIASGRIIWAASQITSVLIFLSRLCAAFGAASARFPMLSKCLNPSCSATFHHMSQGRLFRADFEEAARKSALEGKATVVSIRGKRSSIEYFWLCEKCATTMTVSLSDTGEIIMTPLETAAPKFPVARVRETHKRRAVGAV